MVQDSQAVPSVTSLETEQAIVDAVTAQAPGEEASRQKEYDSARERALTQRITTMGPALDRMEQRLYQAHCLARGDAPYFARVTGRFQDCEGEVWNQDVRVSSFSCMETCQVGDRVVEIPSFRSGIAEVIRDPSVLDTAAWEGQPARGRVRIIEVQVEDVEIRGGRVLAASPRYTTVFEDRVRQRLAQSNRHGLDNMLDVLDREQNRLLNRSDMPLLVVEGGAGTGKTVVALHYAAIHAQPGTTGLYLTPTQTLAEYLRPGLPALGFSHPAFDVQSFEEFVRRHLGVRGLPKVGARRTASATLRALKEAPGTLWSEIEQAHGAVAGRAEKTFRDLLASMLQVLRVALPDADSRLAHVEVSSGQNRFKILPERLLKGPLPGWSEPYIAQIAAVVRSLQALSTGSPVASALLSQDSLSKIQEATAEDPLAVYREALTAACRQCGVESDASLAFEDLAGVAKASLLAGAKLPAAPDFLLVDEAHSFSPSAFRLMAEVIRPSTRVILVGDPNQRPGGGVEDWSQAMAALGRPDAPVVTLQEAYRIPERVQRYATRILGRYAVASVGRPSALQDAGEEPTEIPCLRPETVEDAATRVIRECEQNGLSQVVVMAPDAERARELARRLGERMVVGARRKARAVEVVDGTHPYTGKLAVSWPEAFAGMEADIVIVTDVDAVRYPGSAEAARRLYLALTRAKRRLTVLPLRTPTAEERRRSREEARLEVRQIVVERLLREADQCEQKGREIAGSGTAGLRRGDLQGRASRMRALARRTTEVDDKEFLGFLEQVYNLPQPRPIVREEADRLEAPYRQEPRTRQYDPSPLLAADTDG